MRTRIKICGLTRPQDVDAAVAAGVDAIGFVFYPASPRYVDAQAARLLVRRLPAWMAAVGLFVNLPRDQMLSIADTVGLSHLQLHGDESPEQCAGLGRPVIKALRLKGQAETATPQGFAKEQARLYSLLNDYSDCHAVLFDSDSPGFGGSGQGFDWNLLAPEATQRACSWVLSGGLESGSVGAAIARLNPPCLDVSSGVERREAGTIVKGEKDPQRINEFVAAVQTADQIKKTRS
jgi:phosphoribosylanthranilate isomerase